MKFTPSYRQCPKCGSRFFQDTEWKRICYTCWQSTKQAPPHDEAAHLRAENARLRLQLLQRTLDAPRDPIPSDMLARLIRLCHPDKHGNSEGANIATAWLLSQRQN